MSKRYKIPQTGKTFNNLTIQRLSDQKTKDGRRMMTCVCKCGTIIDVRVGDLYSGHTKSCGCRRYSQQGKSIKHQKEYDAWQGMKRRCYDENYMYYKDYGKRGVKVCARWLNSFQDFLNDVGFAPTKYHSIDRLDSNGNYSPNNVRWATSEEQARNRRISENSIVYLFEHVKTGEQFVGTRYEFKEAYPWVDLNILAAVLGGRRRFINKWSVTCVLKDVNNV